MHGPRLVIAACALALALQACTPRQPIPSEPPASDAAVRETDADPLARPILVLDPEPAKPAPKPAPKPKAAPKPAEPKAAAPAPEAKAPADIPAQAASAQAAAQPPAQEQPAAAPATAAQRQAMVQVGAFSTEERAQGALGLLRQKGYAEGRVVRLEQGQTVLHRVQAGPFQDLAAARKALEELKADWPQAFIPAD